jgi:lycopene beta-cyclase
VKQADLILTGGGLANTLIALRLADAQPQLNVMLLERDDHIGGNHTWSFHGSDLTRVQFDWIKPLIEYSWDRYEVRFPKVRRTLNGTYHSLTSEGLGRAAKARLGDSIHTGVNVADLQPECVVLDDGSRIQAHAVIDGRGPRASTHLDVRFQKFVGRIVTVNRPHGLTGPIIMDATEDQDDGYRFFYTLPFDAQTLLIEDTRYSDSPAISAGEYGDEIARYAAAQGWHIDEVLREEAGVLPITLGGDITAFWDESARVPRSGLQAALFHPATGYSLPSALQLADELAGLGEWSADRVYGLTRSASERLWKRTGFYRALNRMLFLAAGPQERRQVLERFYKLRPGLIARFYAGENTLLDKLRILSGKPPVKMSRAYKAVFGYQSGSARPT